MRDGLIVSTIADRNDPGVTLWSTTRHAYVAPHIDADPRGTESSQVFDHEVRRTSFADATRVEPTPGRDPHGRRVRIDLDPSRRLSERQNRDRPHDLRVAHVRQPFERLDISEPLEGAELQRVEPATREVETFLRMHHERERFCRHPGRHSARPVQARHFARIDEPTPALLEVGDPPTRDTQQRRVRIDDRDLDVGPHGPERIDEHVHDQLAWDDVFAVEDAAVEPEFVFELFVEPLVAAHPVLAAEVVGVVAVET